MHTVKFYPVGNGDCSQIILNNGRRLLFDFKHINKAEGDEHPAIDLKAALSEELSNAKRDYFDVVAFTHADQDHIQGSTDFFELLHAEKYKGKDRIKIKELWVPAAMILEEGIDGEDRTLRQEARYRLIKGKGIRVFSKPDKLKSWLKEQGIALEHRVNLISDAGSCVPNFTLDKEEVEFFIHSPFIEHVDGEDDIQRNASAIILHATFKTEVGPKGFMIIGDAEWETLEKIVTITRSHKNEDRLKWDLYNVPHHCSYLALNDSDNKGKKKTEPKPNVKWLLEQGTEGSLMVSSSDPIKEDYNQEQPPHVQAKNCYNTFLNSTNSRSLIVTMESPNTNAPKPIEVIFDKDGCRPKPIKEVAPSIAIISKPAPRAGNHA